MLDLDLKQENTLYKYLHKYFKCFKPKFNGIVTVLKTDFSFRFEENTCQMTQVCNKLETKSRTTP